MSGGHSTLFGDGPTACPFLALDRDRERRADEPDSRHRCYATPAPEPRALAHQRNYCLTPTFSACPIFQDWAVRAAARPVPMRPVPPALAMIEEARPVGEPELTASDEPIADADRVPDQPGLFDEQVRRASTPPMPTFSLTAPSAEPSATGTPRSDQATFPPPARRSLLPASTPSAVAAPKPMASKPTPSKPVPAKTNLRRDDIVPSWERANYDQPSTEPRSRRGGGGDWFSVMTALFIALAGLSLAIMVVLLLPVLLNSSPGTTPRPTAPPASPTPVASPTPSPTPESTWLTYTIKLGDSLYGIASEFGITYEQLLAANPQITDPNFIRAGDIINIPPPEFEPPSPSGGTGASASP